MIEKLLQSLVADFFRISISILSGKLINTVSNFIIFLLILRINRRKDLVYFLSRKPGVYPIQVKQWNRNTNKMKLFQSVRNISREQKKKKEKKKGEKRLKEGRTEGTQEGTRSLFSKKGLVLSAPFKRDSCENVADSVVKSN